MNGEHAETYIPPKLEDDKDSATHRLNTLSDSKILRKSKLQIYVKMSDTKLNYLHLHIRRSDRF